MTTYIAQFTAKHRIIQIEQNSIFIWQQESGEIDIDLLAGKIKRESSTHFYQLVAGENFEVLQKDLSVTVWKTTPFNG